MIYLDNAATSPITRSVLEAMWPYLTEQFGNASSHHDLGNAALAGLNQARNSVAAILNCDANEVVLTSGGTESNNAAIKGAALADQRRRVIVTSPIEHEAVLEPIAYLERFHGFQRRLVEVDENGLVDMNHLATVLDDDVALCSIQYANSEVGTVQDVGAIGSLCRDRNIVFHCDAVQAPGLLPLRVDDLTVDLLSLSGHKFGGPKGVGVLYKRRNLHLEPLLHGGGQENGARSGTSNVAGAVGLAAALEEADRGRAQFVLRAAQQRDRLNQAMQEAFALSRPTGAVRSRLANHGSYCLAAFSGESLVVGLALRDVAISSGSACAEGKDEPSYVLLALGITPSVAQTAVRFTLGTATTDSDVDYCIDQLKGFASISP